MNTFKITIESVFFIESSRRWALRRCAWQARALYEEFHKFAGNIVSPADLSEKADMFVRKKGLRIINEKPIARAEGDRYVVDACYTIAW